MERDVNISTVLLMMIAFASSVKASEMFARRPVYRGIDNIRENIIIAGICNKLLFTINCISLIKIIRLIHLPLLIFEASMLFDRGAVFMSNG
ncbi:MAG: hypothetical protein QXO47_09090 [Thermoproteota archaeon]